MAADTKTFWPPWKPLDAPQSRNLDQTREECCIAKFQIIALLVVEVVGMSVVAVLRLSPQGAQLNLMLVQQLFVNNKIQENKMYAFPIIMMLKHDRGEWSSKWISDGVDQWWGELVMG